MLNTESAFINECVIMQGIRDLVLRNMITNK